MSETLPAAVPDQNEEALRLVLVDQSKDARDTARDRADERLDRELGEGGRVKQFLNGIWKGNIAKDYYRQKYVRQEEAAIQEAGNIYTDSPEDRRTAALSSTIDRFQSDYEEVIHTETGERREVQADDSEIARGMKDLIRQFAQGRLNETTLQEERTRFLNEYRATNGTEALGAGIASVDNLLAVARAVAGSVEHGQSLDNVINNMQVITGEARNGARTEAQYSKVDTIVDKLSKSRIGQIVSPGTLAVGASIALSVTRFGSHSVLGAIGKTLVPGAAAAAWAGFRENKRTKDERAQHSREMAVGGQFTENDKRRGEMEKTRYQAISAEDLTRHLNEMNAPERLSQGSEAVKAALDALAAVQARVQLSDAENMDLVSYSSKVDVGEERMMLDLARREAKLALEQHLDESTRTELMIAHDQPFSDVLQERADLTKEMLGVELSAKDKAFNTLKRKRIIKAASIGFATGLAGGLIAQEAVAAFDTTRFGLIDAIRGETPTPFEGDDFSFNDGDGEVHQTILEGLVNGEQTTSHVDASSTYESYDTSPNGTIELSDDHALEKNDDGTMDIVTPDGNASVEGLVTDAEGRLDQASLDKIDAAGMVLEDKSFEQDTTTFVEQTVTPEQFVQNHAAETTNVSRELWYGNDTPSVYDENELRLYRGGGPDAPGIVDGGFQYSVAGMTPEGSWQGGESVDWNQAADAGNLFVAVSATVETQDTVFMIPIGPDGAVNIPADSPAGKFFSNEDNAVSFNGRYMEIVQATGVTPEGETLIRPLSTLVGDSSVESLTDVVATPSSEHIANYVITTDGYEKTQDAFTEVAPFLPVVSRRSLESLARARQGEEAEEDGPEARRGGYYSGEVSNAEQDLMRETMSPRIKTNPDARLNLKEETDWYREELVNRHGPERVAALEEFARNNPALRSISAATKSITIIPVAAVAEKDNIYKTLSVLAQQDPDAMKANKILLNVNWMDTAMDDPAKVADMQATIAEIERAQADFPQLDIAVMQKEYNQEEVEKTGGPIGHVVSDVIDAALIAVHNKVASGEIPSDNDILIIRGDADVSGQSRNHLRNMQRTMEENPDIDVAQGTLRWGVADTQRFPSFGMAINFDMALRAAATQENRIWTGGPNFAVRASTLAAVGGLPDVRTPIDPAKPWIKPSGVGSDDVEVGRRITAARLLGGNQSDSRQSYSGPTGSTNASNPYSGPSGSNYGAGRVRRIKSVSGASVDTSAERLLPPFIDGKSYEDAWGGSNPGQFADAQGNYTRRDSRADFIRDAEDDDFDKDKVYDTLEVNFSRILQYVPTKSAERALAFWFAGAPGAYRFESGRIGGGRGENKPVFNLTDAGRAFLKNRAERETNGQYGSYGDRMMRRHYNIVKPGAVRQPVAAMPPLVSPA